MTIETIRAAKIMLLALLGIAAILTAGCDESSSSGFGPPPAIAFVTPTSGATAEVGTTVRISLRVTNAAAFDGQIFVLGAGPLGDVVIAANPPFAATLTVPSDLDLGDYTLTAVGHVASLPSPVTASTAIRVVPAAGSPPRLQPLPPLVFEAIGERLPITVPGQTEGLQYRSDAPDIATVSGPGIVTAARSGDTEIKVSQNGTTIGSVDVHVLTPALLPSVTRLDFGNQRHGTESSAKSVTLTNDALYPVTVLEVGTGTVFPKSDDCVSDTPLAPGASCTVSVSFAPTKTGSVGGALMIVDDAVIASTRILLSGTGT